MSHPYKALFISPMIPSFNLKETGQFFQSLLGFTALMDTETYAIYAKDQLTIHLLPAGGDIGQMEFYMEVDDIEVFWDSIRQHVDGLRVKAPFDQPYGMREVHIEIPQTRTLLMIGQDIVNPVAPL